METLFVNIILAHVSVPRVNPIYKGFLFLLFISVRHQNYSSQSKQFLVRFILDLFARQDCHLLYAQCAYLSMNYTRLTLTTGLRNLFRHCAPRKREGEHNILAAVRTLAPNYTTQFSSLSFPFFSRANINNSSNNRLHNVKLKSPQVCDSDRVKVSIES